VADAKGNTYQVANTYVLDDPYENMGDGTVNGRGTVRGGGFGGTGGMAVYHNQGPSGVPPMQPTNVDRGLYDALQPYSVSSATHPTVNNAGGSPTRHPPALPSHPPNARLSGLPLLPSDGSGAVNPSDLPLYDDVMRAPNQYPPTLPRPSGTSTTTVSPSHGGGSGIPSDFPALPDVPGLPSVPVNSVGASSAGGNDDVDFDDLTRRFEELKKRK
jgi:vacuolar protein sorting-associated protein IST1